MHKIILIAILISAVISAQGCSKKDQTASLKPCGEVEEGGKDPSLKHEVYSFRVEGFGKDKKVEWGLEGASACVVADKINISELKAVYYGENMTFTVFADKAVYDKKTQNIELKENIVGSTSDGGELVTTHAEWNADRERIVTDEKVVVTRDNITCIGKGMSTKPRLKKIRFLKDIEVSILPDKKILCDGPFEIDHEKNVAVFRKNVRIVEKDSETLTDKLTVYIDPDTHEVDRVITEGNVKVVHRGDVKDLGRMSF
jgi:LPS export ABC transporter protein LptC